MPAKKESGITRKAIGVLTVLLVIFILIMMRLVSGIQGTARVVNYAGLVRGGTQRWIKMEITGNPRDKMMEAVESYIDGLQNGSEDLGLVRLKDAKYQAKVEEQKEYFQKLKEEVQHVRESGYYNTNIIEDSETFFQICDDATGLAEAYSQRKASQLDILEKVVTVDILALIFLTALELVRALRYAALNRELQKKVYLDEATGIPNKNKCEELLSAAEPVTEKVALCVFDLNNLRVINNSLGHEKGDAYIRNFAQLLYEIVPKEYFVKGKGSNKEGLIVTGKDKNTTYITPEIFYEKDGMYYIDDENVTSGTVIQKSDSNETYTIRQTAKLKGVYNINKGYAVFKQIDILYQNEEYAILKQGTDYGVALYDHIALKGNTVKENDLIH